MGAFLTILPPRRDASVRTARRLAARCVVLTAVALLSTAGCRRETTESAPPAAAAALSPEVYTTPQHLASALFDALRAERNAIASRDSEAIASAEATIAELADRVELHRRLSAQPQFKPLLGTDFVGGYLKLWGATAGYYLDGIDLARAEIVPSTSAHHVTLRIPAQHGKSHATLFLELMRGSDQRWLAVQLDFGASAKPATRPATRPADAGEASTSAPASTESP